MRRMLWSGWLVVVASSWSCAQENIEAARELPKLDVNYFRCQVQPVLAARCSFMACHGTAYRPLHLYAEQRYRLGISWDDYETPLTDSELAANFDMVRGFVGVADSGADLLSEKPLDTAVGGLFHRGKDLFGSVDVFVSHADPGYRILRSFAEGETASDDCVAQENVGP